MVTPIITCKLCNEMIVTQGNIKTLLEDKPEIRIAFEKIALKAGGDKGAEFLGVFKDKEKQVANYVKSMIMHHLFSKHKKYIFKNFPKRKKQKKGWDATKKVMDFDWEILNKYGVEE